jgi:hypothetical protein
VKRSEISPIWNYPKPVGNFDQRNLTFRHKTVSDRLRYADNPIVFAKAVGHRLFDHVANVDHHRNPKNRTSWPNQMSLHMQVHMHELDPPRVEQVHKLKQTKTKSTAYFWSPKEQPVDREPLFFEESL